MVVVFDSWYISLGQYTVRKNGSVMGDLLGSDAPLLLPADLNGSETPFCWARGTSAHENPSSFFGP